MITLTKHPKPSLSAKVIQFLFLILVLLWPALISGGPFYVADTPGYYHRGGAALDILEKKLADFAATRTAEVPAGEDLRTNPTDPDDMSVTRLRSAFFAVFTNLSMRTMGVYAPIVIMSAAMAALIMAFLADLPQRRQIVVGLATAGLTLLPFYTSQLSADVFAGYLVLATLILVVRSRISTTELWVLLGVIYFSIMAHYSHIPLGLVMCLTLCSIFLARGMTARALAALVPFVLALVTSIGISLALPNGSDDQQSEATADAAPQTPTRRISVAPARYPILLARSLEDGPAFLYLQENCQDSRFTICEIYDEFPTNAGAALWGPDSINKRATPEQLERISSEELDLLWAAFKTYPVMQIFATAKNGWLQFIRFGTPPVRAATISIVDSKELSIELRDPFFQPWDTQIMWAQVAVLVVAVLAFFASYKHLSASMRTGFWVLLLALIVNALVCGGLSAPVNRYQGRIVWCVALLGFAAWAARPKSMRRQDG
ncbi:hypothetical protein N9C96_00880 [bacterium]|nr:hypothetical protein [bacterium]